MQRIHPFLLSTLASVALGFAQEGRGGGRPPADPTKLIVTSRVYDKKALLSAPVLPEDAQRGRAMWLQRCAFCHDGVGQPTYKTMGPWLDSEKVRSMSVEEIGAFIRRGTQRMPGFVLTPKQINDLVAFLKTVPPANKPTAAQLNGINTLNESAQ
jgi:mono/diheme cytochrome c family protein